MNDHGKHKTKWPYEDKYIFYINNFKHSVTRRVKIKNSKILIDIIELYKHYWMNKERKIQKIKSIACFKKEGVITRDEIETLMFYEWKLLKRRVLLTEKKRNKS